jgi:hypothetical protein
MFIVAIGSFLLEPSVLSLPKFAKPKLRSLKLPFIVPVIDEAQFERMARLA